MICCRLEARLLSLSSGTSPELELGAMLQKPGSDAVPEAGRAVASDAGIWPGGGRGSDVAQEAGVPQPEQMLGMSVLGRSKNLDCAAVAGDDSNANGNLGGSRSCMPPTSEGAAAIPKASVGTAPAPPTARMAGSDGGIGEMGRSEARAPSGAIGVGIGRSEALRERSERDSGMDRVGSG